MLTFKKLAMVLLPLNLTIMTAHADMKSANIGLPSSGMSLVRQATLIKPIEPDKTIHFTVWLKLRNKKQLDQLVNEIYDPNSASYQRFLTSEELTQQYVPSQAAEDAVQRYFTAQGMDAEIVNHTVRVTAKIHQVEQALQVKMNYYRFQNRTVYANATAPSLSVDLAPLVLSISGLSDMAHFKPNIRSINRMILIWLGNPSCHLRNRLRHQLVVSQAKI